MSELTIDTWGAYIADQGIEPIVELENECWAPWLAASPESLEGRSKVFAEGQWCIYSKLGLLATLSVNKIEWDGQTESLPTWDEVAGDPTTYAQTYRPNGNTLCLMSMNVSPLGRGRQLPSKLVQALLGYAESSGVEHVIGSFRPSAYSQAVLKAVDEGQEFPVFDEYCATTNEQGDPIDPWLRSLSKNGMQPIVVDSKAMTVPVTAEEFESFKQPSWQLLEINGKPAVWCGETGFFYPQPDGSYVYTESNLWGSLYEK